MRVISENSEDDLKRRRADETLGAALRALAANLIRVARGAGAPYEIYHQVQHLKDAHNIYLKAFGHLPTPEKYANHLCIGKDARILKEISTEERLRIYAEEGIIRASLQIVASRMLGQKTQASNAENMLYSAIFDLDEARAMQRAKFTTEAKTAKAPKKRRIKAKKSANNNN